MFRKGERLICVLRKTGYRNADELRVDEEYVCSGADSTDNPVCVRDASGEFARGWYPEDCFKLKDENGKGGFKMFKTLKEYFNKHQDMIITVAVVIIADQVIFKGAFRERIQKLFENMLGSVEKKVAIKED